MSTLPFSINISMSLNIALASCKELVELPKLNNFLSPVVFTCSQNQNYFKKFAETSLALEKKFFFDNVVIDYVFYAVDDNLDRDRFQEFLKNKLGLLNNSILFTSPTECSSLESLTQHNMLHIVNGNFFCNFKIFCMFHGFYKFNKSIIKDKFNNALKLKYSNELQIDIFTLIFLLKRLNIKILSLHYDR